jgi:hypothetical protein
MVWFLGFAVAALATMAIVLCFGMRYIIDADELDGRED